MKRATIREVRAYVQEPGTAGSDYHDHPTKHWIVDSTIANPMSVYPEYRGSRTTWGINALGSVIVEIELDDGTTGVGVSTGGEPACFIVERHLSRFVEGRDPRNVELIWDQMWRATMPYGRKGLPIQALSAVDLAIWDALGKLRDEPVYALLGGKTKERLPVYATTARPDLAQSLGFEGAKFPLPCGPGDGDEGLRRNVARVAEARASVGPEFPLRIDCYMALNVNYTIALARAVEPYHVHWLEEFLPPDDYDGYAQVKAAVSTCLLTTGEHEYTRYGFRELINRRCIDILQPDITWVGGITEARRIVALAAAYDLPVIPHGSSVFSYHLQYAFPNCHLAEFVVLSPEADRIVPLFGGLFPDEPLPEGGFIDLPDRPGFGVTLGKSGLRRPYRRTED